MCGRFSNSLTQGKLEEYMTQVQFSHAFVPNYNISPSQSSYIVSNKRPFSSSEMAWGLLPYNKDSGPLLINARSETIFEKATFKYAIRERRCLVLADSFYEWKKIGREKIPYRIVLKEKQLMVFAGIYNEWTVNNTLFSGFVILTTSPNKEMERVHKRAPVILNSEEEQMQWISDISKKDIEFLTRPLANDSLHIYMVSTAVNKASNNSLNLHREIPEQPTLF